MFELMLLTVHIPVALSKKCRIYANFLNDLNRASATILKSGNGKSPLISCPKAGGEPWGRK